MLTAACSETKGAPLIEYCTVKSLTAALLRLRIRTVTADEAPSWVAVNFRPDTGATIPKSLRSLSVKLPVQLPPLGWRNTAGDRRPGLPLTRARTVTAEVLSFNKP